MGILETALTGAALKKVWRPRVLLGLSLGLVLVPSVASLRVGAQENQAPPSPPQATTMVIVLPPQIVTERLSENSSTRDQGDESFETALKDAATTEISEHKYSLVTPEGLQNPDAVVWLKQLEPLTSRLARGAVNDDAQLILDHLRTLPREYLILVQFMRIKNAPGASYNAWSGAITSGMSSTLLQAALISTRTGQVVWKNEVLVRKLFPANDPRFAKSIETLYQTFGTAGGN